MEVISQNVKTAKSLFLPLQETIIMPIGDVQYAGGGVNDACDLNRLQRHLEWGMKRGAYFLGMGDYIDVASPSNRDAVRHAKMYDSLQDALEEINEQYLEKFKSVLKGTEGRWLGLLEGHHFWEFADGATTDTRLCQALKAPFLGDCAFVRLVFKSNGKQRTGCTIWCHHGVGSGKLAGAPLNSLEHIIKAFEADIYLMGHMHKKVAAPMNRVYVNWDEDPPRMRHRNVIIGCTGGFLCGYLQGSKRAGRAQGTYVEQKMLNPTALGGLVVYVRPRNTHGRYGVDLSVEQ